MKKRNEKYKTNTFICKRCGKKTIYISFGNASVFSSYCNSCRNGLAEGGTGNLLEYPCRNKDGKINFKMELYEIRREFVHLGLKKGKKHWNVVL